MLKNSKIISGGGRHPSNTGRREAAEAKYSRAVEIYASTGLSIREIADECGVTPSGLSAHVGRYHRDLLFKRYCIEATEENLSNIQIKRPKGQSFKTFERYKDAIEACKDIAYIELNVSQVARLYKLDGTALAAQLRAHFPEIIPDREALRHRLGVGDNTPRGVRAESVATYAEALQMYKDTDLTMREVSEKCRVSLSGFCQFLRFYHKDVMQQKEGQRASARKDETSRTPGTLSGSGGRYGPKPETAELYANALELYEDTSMTIKEIAEQTGVPLEGFKSYLRKWHRDKMLGRRRPDGDGMQEENGFDNTKRYLKSTASKYAPAIARMRETPGSIAEVAREFGLNPEVFREYLKEHEPELVAEHGMMAKENGKIVKRSSYEKYASAVEEYATTAETLKDIAKRHGLTYTSLFSFIKRNCQEEMRRHAEIVAAATKHYSQTDSESEIIKDSF